MTPGYALDENRKKQYEEAQALLKDPYIGVDALDPDDPGHEDDDDKDKGGGAISMPWQKFPSQVGDEGFSQVYPWLRWF